MMFSNYGLPDLAQVNIMTDLARIQEVYSSLVDDERHPDHGYSEQILKITYDKFPYRIED